MQKRRKYITAHKRERRPRINDQIRAARVLQVDEADAEEMTVDEALVRDKEQELDLIEVSPKAKPPVVKIGDFGQYLYQIKKKEQKQRAHSKPTEVKTLRMSFRTDRHDLERIMDRAKEFFSERHMVKLVIQLRGRELTNKAYAKEKLLGVANELGDSSEVEQEIKPQGNQFIVILRPKRGGKKEEE